MSGKTPSSSAHPTIPATRATPTPLPHGLRANRHALLHHAAWLDDGALLRDAYRLGGIPGTLVHGYLDLGGPVYVAWELARVWPDAELVICGTAGHFGAEMTEAALRAIDRFADR